MESERNMQINFVKMHGLGNDFMVIDARNQTIEFSTQLITSLACRHTGVGFDQAIILRPSHKADAFMQIINADGSEVAACGNATRCVGLHLMRESKTNNLKIETLAGILQAEYVNENQVKVQMGVPNFEWETIPLATQMDILAVEHGETDLPFGVCVNIGNPHLVIYMEDIWAHDLSKIGARLEVSELFPERANISFAQKITENHIKILTWERGVGITQACGTAACASFAAGVRLGILANFAHVEMIGGMVEIAWAGDATSLIMQGEAAYAYYGYFNI
jgi:diaminopimelate epimerase